MRALAVLGLLFFLFTVDGVTSTVQYTPCPNEILKNPDMGLLLPIWMNSGVNATQWRTQVCSVGYNRWRWSALESTKGTYDFSLIDTFISNNQSWGLRSALRIMSSVEGNTGTPSYVFATSVPGASHCNATQTDPVFWHAHYLTLYDVFVAALGNYLNGGINFDFLDMGGIGTWGEMQFSLHKDTMWSQDELDCYGFSETVLLGAYKEMIQNYISSFDNTNLFLNIAAYHVVTDGVSGYDIGFRWDGLRPESDSSAMISLTSTFNQYGPAMPCIFEFASMYTTLADIQGCMAWVRQNPINYLCVNLGDLEGLSSEIKAEIESIAKDVGYRFVISETQLTDQEYRWHVTQEWKNEGLANSRQDYDFYFYVYDNGVKVHTGKAQFPVKTSQWDANETINVDIDLTDIPEDGNYTVRFSLVDSNSSSIYLGVQGRDGNGTYELGTI